MVDLLGENSRFAGSQRNLDFTGWLGRGIDSWIYAVVDCFKALLLSGSRATTTVTTYYKHIQHFFSYLAEGGTAENVRVPVPAKLSPLHIQGYIGWLQKRAHAANWTVGSTRSIFSCTKAVVLEMLTQGLVLGEPKRLFPRMALPWRGDASHQTSLSDAEQHRLADAIKADLVAVHHKRLELHPKDQQALRLLLVAHRQGLNPTPIVEMSRDAMGPGVLPGTVCITIHKHRSKKRIASSGRSAQLETTPASIPVDRLVFSLAEGAVLQQAITSTASLVADAPTRYKNRIWLYRTSYGKVSCLSTTTLRKAIAALIERHRLLSDSGDPLVLNLSRLRKSLFDRAMRLAEGDLSITANLMGNTPQVAGANYPSMNDARKADAARFMNADYTAPMRKGSRNANPGRPIIPLVIEVVPVSVGAESATVPQLENTPLSHCKDTLNGEYAPHDGRNHCDRYVMCLFCSSFAIVGTTEELWRMYSFQAFAKAELAYLDGALGPQRTDDSILEDLRDRYRLAIPFVDDLTERQFPRSAVLRARKRLQAGLHPFWKHQMTMSRAARGQRAEPVHILGKTMHTDDLEGTHDS